jgi:hypothetical protein
MQMNDASEIVKSGAFNKIADIVHKLAGPMAEEYGLLLADKAKVYRLKNWVNVITKTEKILRDANLPPNAVPPRMFLPILEASSLEDDETLQDLWAGLLATASQQADSVSPSFIETLKQLTPNEARHLEHVYKTIQKTSPQWSMANAPVTPYAFTEQRGVPSGVSSDTFERLGLIRRDFDLKLRSLTRRKPPSSIEEAIDAVEPEMRYQFVFTQYAVSFLEACNGPHPSPEISQK